MDKREMIMAKLKIVCKCRHVSLYTIRKAIEDGAHDIKAVEKACTAHTGACGGVRCGDRINELLAEHAKAD